MRNIKESDRVEYWEDNIVKWSHFYDKGSEEQIIGPSVLRFVYKKLVLPIEKKYMTNRFKMTMHFIKKHAKEATQFADIGCGTGIFTKEILKLNSNVYAIDYSKAALEATQKTVSCLPPEQLKKIEYKYINVTAEPIPKCDFAICLGVVPYITNLEAFFKNVLPNVNQLLCSYVSSKNMLNKIRVLLPVLNVRKLVFVNPEYISSCYKIYKFELVERLPLATGFVDNVKRLDK